MALPVVVRVASPLILLGGLALAPGCGGSDRPPGAAARRADENPRPGDAIVRGGVRGTHGGRYVAMVRSDPSTWNALVSNDAASTTFTSGLLFRSLVFFNFRTQETEPWLARDWEVNSEGTEWTFHLRRGIRWSDGTPMTADDFLFTVEALFDTALASPVADLATADGEAPRFTKIDAHTIRVTLSRPYAALLDLIGSIFVLPRHALEPAYRDGRLASAYGVDTPPSRLVTCGPWVLAEYAPGEKVVLRPNPHYYVFDEDGNRLPYLDELVFRIVPDQNAEVLSFRTGASDEIYLRGGDYAPMKDGEAAGDYLVFDLGSELGTNFLWFNLNPGANPATGRPFVEPWKLAVFSNPDFRRAVSHCVDRTGIVNTVYHGQGEPLYGAIPPANLKWHNPDIPRFEYDPERARRLLDAAGLRDRDGDGFREDAGGHGLSITLLVQGDNRERQMMAEIVADDLVRAGIRTTVAGLEFNAMITRLFTSFDYDAMVLGLTSGVPPDPNQGANVFKSSGETHLWNPGQSEPATPWEAEIDDLMDRQRAAMDPAERKRLFDRVQVILAEQQPMIYIAARRGLLAVRNRFMNLKPSVLAPWVLWESETISVDPARNGG